MVEGEHLLPPYQTIIKQPLFHILLAILDDDATIATVHPLARDVIDAVVILLDDSARNLLNAC